MDVRKFVKSFHYAWNGIIIAGQQQNMRVHLVSTILVIIAGFWTKLSITEWLIITLVIALVLGTELVNTAIESVVDLVSPEYHPLAKQAKDVAAGAVLVFAMASVIIGILIFFPKWFF